MAWSFGFSALQSGAIEALDACTRQAYWPSDPREVETYMACKNIMRWAISRPIEPAPPGYDVHVAGNASGVGGEVAAFHFVRTLVRRTR